MGTSPAQPDGNPIGAPAVASPAVASPAAVERWADKIAAAHGFTDVSHTLEIFGACAGCTAAP
jgi:hypothetical protein